jgi:hypothetical protein
VKKMDINPMNAQIKRKKKVKLTLPKHRDRMLRKKMMREEDP